MQVRTNALQNGVMVEICQALNIVNRQLAVHAADCK